MAKRPSKPPGRKKPHEEEDRPSRRSWPPDTTRPQPSPPRPLTPPKPAPEPEEEEEELPPQTEHEAEPEPPQKPKPEPEADFEPPPLKPAASPSPPPAKPAAVVRPPTGPQRYDILNKNQHAARVIYNSDGKEVQIPPNQWRWGVWLDTATAAQLNQGDLLVKAST